MSEINTPPDDGWGTPEDLRALMGAPVGAAPIPIAMAATPPVRGDEDPATWDEGRANRCLRALGLLERDLAGQKLAAEAEVKAIQAWLTDVEERYERAIERHRALLQRWYETHPPAGKKKSRDLPAGRLGTRDTVPGIDVADEAAAIAWLEANLPSAVKIERKVLKTAVEKANLPALPPGLVVRPATTTFYVRAQSASDVPTTEEFKEIDDEGQP